jgi:hypothetical protein
VLETKLGRTLILIISAIVIFILADIVYEIMARVINVTVAVVVSLVLAVAVAASPTTFGLGAPQGAIWGAALIVVVVFHAVRRRRGVSIGEAKD